MLESGELPALAGVYARSIRGELLARSPMLSPVLWSTIFTSKLPEEHGVHGWKRALASHRRVKTVWTIAEEAGRTSRVLNVPSTWPPQTLRGTTVAGMPVPRSTPINGTGSVLNLVDGSFAHPIVALVQESLSRLCEIGNTLAVDEWSPWIELSRVENPDRGGRVKLMRLDRKRAWVSPLYRFGPRVLISDPTEFISDLEAATGRPYIPEGPGFRLWHEPATARYLYPHLLDLTSMHIEAAEALLDTPWDLFVYVNTFVDRISHLYWPFMSPGDYKGVTPQAAARFGGRVGDAYREADRQLGELLPAVDEDTYVVILSDHGFRSPPRHQNRIGMHSPEGIYMIAGPGIQPTDGPRQRDVDVGATILYLLGIPPARDMTGQVFAAVASQLGPPAEGPETYETETAGSRPIEEPVVLETDEREALEQVRSLGYLDLDESTASEEAEELDSPPD